MGRGAVKGLIRGGGLIEGSSEIMGEQQGEYC